MKAAFVFSILSAFLILTFSDPSSINAQEGEIIFKEPTPAPTPPLSLGDLNQCINQLPTPQDICDQVCATKNKCTLVCTYRLTSKGECYPHARCGDCAEIPPDDLPLDPSGGGDTR